MPANDPAALLIDASVRPHFPSHSTSPPPTRWAPTRFPSCWWRQAEPPAGPGAPSSLCTPPTRGGCSRWAAATACSSPWPTPPPWTWTRRAASSGRFSSARGSDSGSDPQTPTWFESVSHQIVAETSSTSETQKMKNWSSDSRRRQHWFYGWRKEK